MEILLEAEELTVHALGLGPEPGGQVVSVTSLAGIGTGLPCSSQCKTPVGAKCEVKGAYPPSDIATILCRDSSKRL